MNLRLLNRGVFMLLAAGILLMSLLCFRSDDPRVTRILTQIETFTNRSKLQKIYLKTDKEKYITGETIWLKAYVLNAASLKSTVESNEIFVDLIGRNNLVFHSIILRNTDGYSNGDLALSDSLPEGNYQIVAYTNWMKNFDEAFYFSKTVQIVNPHYNKYLTQNELSQIKQFNKDILSGEKERIVQFFPESGNMVAGIQSRIAFKAINKLGYGVNVKGEIIDNSNNRICHFESKHLGMGVFTLTPESGKKYYANVTFEDNETRKFELPAVEQKGFVLTANTLIGDQVRLNIQSNVGNQMDESQNEFILVGQSRGEIRYVAKVVNKGKPVNTTIPKKYFPAGISQIIIFDGQGIPVCERLIFIHPKETENPTTVNVANSTDGGDLVYKIQLKDLSGSAAEGNLTFSLSENNNGKTKWNENILSNLLVTSDLKGKVENATDYFKEDNPEALMNLDYLMMVNGWRRFVWKEIIAGQFAPLLYAPSEGINPNEISTTIVKRNTINLHDKQYLVALNEAYDAKMIRKNTRESLKMNVAPAGESMPNGIIVDHTSNSFPDMVQYLKGRISGVMVMDNGIKIRGVNSINSGTDPLILQDNSSIPFSTLRMISPNDVASVEVLKGPDASIYGARGANGVVILHMRTGLSDQAIATPETVTERVISFYKAREFYVPAYDAWDIKPSDYNVPRSVFWRPNIIIDSTGKAEVRIKNKSVGANLKVSIEGIAADGSVLFYESSN